MGIDPSFGSSSFGIVATRFENERIEVVIAEQHERPQFESMINRIFEIRNQIGNISAIYVDSGNSEVWSSLKREFNEDYRDKYVFDRLAYYKKNNLNPANYMKIIPVPFSTQGACFMTKNSYSSDVGTQSNVRYKKYHLRSHIFPFDVPSGFDSY